jgi:N-acetyl-alpha-D-muramate 1-phosphate uridylyltransferase
LSKPIGMTAMVLAAGFGTRLRPLTDRCPKALVQIDKKPLLQIILDKLIQSGILRIAVNGHHLSKQIATYVEKYSSNHPAEITFSQEKEILDTGGGIKNMARLLAKNLPVLVHNVDILSEINFLDLYEFHVTSSALCTLALHSGETDRPLLFDEHMLLCGRGPLRKPALVRKPHGEMREFGFCGVQIITPELFLEYPGDKFNSMDVYLRAGSWEKKIAGYDIGSNYWRDVGSQSDLYQAEQDIKKGMIKFR